MSFGELSAWIFSPVISRQELNIMFQIRPAAERGHFDHGWLNTYHTFSFARYLDRSQMGFRALRVINEDWVQPGRGFGMHGHQDMEIVTLVLEGALEHRDSLGHGAVLHPGEFQRISAGTGIEHSEFNPSSTEPVHLYQIWLLPDRPGHTPRYDQREFSATDRHNRLQLVASPEGTDDSLSIHQQTRIWLATLDAGKSVSYELPPDRHAWLQVLNGGVSLAGQQLVAGDGMAVSDEPRLEIAATEAAEILLFDLP